ncbi:IQ motif-containing protein H [Odontesthes bonariensis]
MHVICNPAHQNNRASVHQKCGPLLPDVTRRNTNAAHHDRNVSGTVVGLQVGEPKGRHFDAGTVEQPSMPCLSVQHKAAALHPREDLHTFKTGSNSRCLKQPKWQTDSESLCVRKDDECTPPWTTKTPPPSNTSKSMDQRDRVQGNSSLIPKSPQNLLMEVPVNFTKYPFTVIKGEIEPMANLVSRSGQRYRGEGGIDVAAIRIQSCWRRYVARAAYLCHCRRKWAVGIIAISWLMHAQMRRVRKNLQARRFRQLENSRSRAQHMAANWKHIQSSKRTIIHIPSLGYSQTQRLNLRRLGILQNVQMSRLCDIRDENVEVIYICSQHLGDDILLYYTSLLKCDGATDGADTRTTQALSCRRRFIILTPEAVDYFPAHNMCLSTLLKYSPRTLKRIRNLIMGKQAYIVGGVAHMDDLAVADELDVPILGPEPAIFQLYNTKSEGRKIFARAEVDVPPGQGDVYSLYQLHETLAELMTQNITVQRWLLKIDSEHGGRGTAYCDVCHLSSYNWALQRYHRYGLDLWNSKWIQEPVLLRYLDEIPEWLAHYAQPAKSSCYPSWACFLKTFLRQGGVVEANPPSESVTYLTVDMLLEPGGEVTMLSCGDQLHGSCHLEAIGSTVPQTSIHPETLHSICMHVGQACLQRLIVGYVSVGLATFEDPSSMEQKVWAVDLNIAYSDQLAMTQMLLMVTGGTLNWRTGCLEMPIEEKCCERQITSKPPVVTCYAVIGTHLYHSNLSLLYHNVFFKMCNMNGIGFNKKRKQGTVFALYDSSERCTIGMITVSEDLPGALVTFARNLSVIHQEISSPKTQGETNFKELIKNINDVLKMTRQNKKLLKEKSAA